MPQVRGKTIEVLFPAETIARRNLELAKEIAARDFHDLLVVSMAWAIVKKELREYCAWKGVSPAHFGL